MSLLVLLCPTAWQKLLRTPIASPTKAALRQMEAISLDSRACTIPVQGVLSTVLSLQSALKIPIFSTAEVMGLGRHLEIINLNFGSFTK